MRRRLILTATVLALLVLASTAILAQSGGGVDLSWHVMGSAGITDSSGSNVALSGTLGQMAVGDATGGNVSLTGGFWYSVATYELTVNKTGTGGGGVTSSPAGIDCGGTCSASYTTGTVVTLTATPDSASRFAGWSGGGCSGTGTCVATMNAAQSVTATFTRIYTLDVTRTGTGGGLVTSSPTGINCGSTCSASFDMGTVVTLTATPNGTSTFDGWSGACTGTGPCVITMDAAKSVTATFTDTTPPPPSAVCDGYGSATPNVITGTGNGETLTGTSLVDHIFGLGGADTLDALDGNDCLDGGVSNDTLLGGAGFDLLAGGADDDALDGGLNDDTLDGGPGIDSINGSGGYDTITLRGNEGEFDTLNGGDNTDNLLNADSTQPLILNAFAASNSIEGVNGNVQPILGNGSANVLDFSAVGTVSGVTYIGGEGGNDTITGSNGADILRGGADADTLNGVYGSDTLYGDAGDDTLNGGDGVDYLYGGAGNDLIASGGGRDHIYFDPAEDTGDSELARISDMTISDRIHLGAYGLSVAQAVSGSDLIITLPGGKTIRILGRTSALPSYVFVF